MTSACKIERWCPCAERKTVTLRGVSVLRFKARGNHEQQCDGQMTPQRKLTARAFYHRGHRGHREGTVNFTQEQLNHTTGQVLDAAIKVHSALGPGLLESAYKACLAYELRKRGLHVALEVDVPIIYDGFRIELGFRIDLLVEHAVVVEVKAISKVLPVHEAQLLSHLKLGHYPIGLMINFHARRLKDGITRLAN
jgi:GxxExxY protein